LTKGRKGDTLSAMKPFVEVAIGLPISKTFHYRIPEKMKGSLHVGMRVLIPFKGRKVTGFTLSLQEKTPEGVEEKLRDVEEILDEIPVIDSSMLRFCRWVADYYLHPLGEVIKTGLPPGLQLRSQTRVSLTSKGRECLRQGGLDPLQEKVFRKIEDRGTPSLTAVMRAFPGEVGRSQLSLWGSHGLLTLHGEIKGDEVKPKFERVIQLKEGGISPALSKKKAEVLLCLKERGEICYSELSRRFKSLARILRSLETMGLITVSSREVFRDLSIPDELTAYPRPHLTPDQQAVFTEIQKAILSSRYAPFLIHGVTGSGKTEIYLRAIEEVLKQGQDAIVLVPEISLTPQLLARFKDRFGDDLALLHSGLGKGERYDQWRKVWKGEVRIALGARSAVFAPFRKLGIIIVDEEHDPSYKQEEKLKYHARDLAVVRARQAEATLVLGSATPSLESYQNARTGKFKLLRLPQRIEGKPLPHVEILDVRKEEGLLSERLRAALQKNVEQKKQSLLFLNRRGFANFILCPDCGLTFKCPNCSVTLTHHLKERSLQCHYCDYQIPAPGDCPRCGGHRLRGIGTGTERLEQEIRSLFPDVKVARMDRDTTVRKHAHQRILKAVETGAIDILVGTQMIVKGHDFPNVTFVGVVSADTSLHFPDFRSSERTFQLLTQVAGRAGRGESAGEVVIQTFNPDHYSILRAKDHDFIGFFEEEIPFRKALEYPPFSRLINFKLTGNSEKKTEALAEEMERAAHALLDRGYRKGIQILGPSTAPFAKMRGKFRWQMLAKGKSSTLLRQFARDLALRMEDRTRGRVVSLDIDVDPIFIL
jgi:primosomal protein N' (replication factor Y)